MFDSFLTVIITMLISCCTFATCECLNDENDFSYVNGNVEGRKKPGSDILSKILANLAMPFIMQAMFLPLILVFMKLTVLKSMLIGKLGIILWIYNIISNSKNPPGALYSHSINIKHQQPYGQHYGVGGDEKYEEFRNRKRRRR